MYWKLSRLGLAMALLLLAVSSLAVVVRMVRFHPRGGSARVLVTPLRQRVEATSENSRIAAKYKVSNVGDRELVFGKASTSCGCTVASIEPKILKPGQSGEVTILGTPTAWDEKTVYASISCEVLPAKEVVLELTMIGTQPIPYFLSSSGPARFGLLENGRGKATIDINTIDALGVNPGYIR